MEQQASTSRSPVPQRTQALMTFPQAIEAIIHQDARITKLEWNDDSYAELRDGFLMIRLNNKWYRWTLSDGDLLGEDWIIFKK